VGHKIDNTRISVCSTGLTDCQ